MGCGPSVPELEAWEVSAYEYSDNVCKALCAYAKVIFTIKNRQPKDLDVLSIEACRAKAEQAFTSSEIEVFYHTMTEVAESALKLGEWAAKNKKSLGKDYEKVENALKDAIIYKEAYLKAENNLYEELGKDHLKVTKSMSKVLEHSKTALVEAWAHVDPVGLGARLE